MTSDIEFPERSASAPALTWGQLAEASRPVLYEAARRLSAHQLAPVNTALVSPAGFDPRTAAGVRSASLRSSRQGSQITDRGHVLADLGIVPILDRAGLQRLRPYSHVQIAADRSAGPVQLAATVAQLMVAGVPVVVDELPLVARRLLGERLSTLLGQLNGTRLSDTRYLETWSLRARRSALLQLTSAGRVGTLIPVTVIADLVPSPAGRELLGQIAAQDWPATQILLASAGEPAPLPAVLTEGSPSVEVVTGHSREEARRLALARCDGLLATFMSADLLYGAHHVTDLVLGHGYARTAVVGVSVRRSYVPALDLCVEADGHAGERPESSLTGGTLISTPDQLGTIEPHIAAVDVDAPRGFAIHDLGVARRVPANSSGIDRALAGAVSQSSGWTEAIIDGPPDSPSLPSWARPEPDSDYDSYFTRSLTPPA